MSTALLTAPVVAAADSERIRTLRTLLRLTDELRAHVMGGRLEAAAETQSARDALLHRFFAESVCAAERTAMIEACCAMLDMDRAVLSCLEINRAQTIDGLVDLQRSRSGIRQYRAPGTQP